MASQPQEDQGMGQDECSALSAAPVRSQERAENQRTRGVEARIREIVVPQTAGTHDKTRNSRMEEGPDPDIFFRKIDDLAEELETVDEHVTQQRKMDVIMSGMPPEYDLTRCFQAMIDPEFPLEELKFTMRNMNMNGYTTSKRSGRGPSVAAGFIKNDKSKVKCHLCGKIGHFKYECTKTGGGQQAKEATNSRKFKLRQNDSN